MLRLFLVRGYLHNYFMPILIKIYTFSGMFTDQLGRNLKCFRDYYNHTENLTQKLVFTFSTRITREYLIT